MSDRKAERHTSGEGDRKPAEKASYQRELEETLTRYRLDLTAERAKTRRLLAGAFSREQALHADVEGLTQREQALHTEVEGLTQREQALRNEFEEGQTRGTMLEAQLREAADRSGQLEGENLRLNMALETTREEVEAWKRSHDEAREGGRYLQSELAKWSGSKFGRMASLYWRTRSRLSRRVHNIKHALSKGPGRSAGRPVPAAGIGTVAASSQPSVVSGPVKEEMGRPIAVPDGFQGQPSGAYDVVVFSIIDWDFRFQRPQQLALQYGRHGHRAFYLSTSRFLSRRGLPAELELKAPGVAEVALRSSRPLEIYAGKLTEEDVDVLVDSLTSLAIHLGMGDVVAMVQIPFWEPLAVRLRDVLGWHVVYDCMDEWANFPGFGEDVLRLEAKLTEESDLTVVSGETLVSKFDDGSNKVLLAKNGIDLSHYDRFFGENSVLEGMKHPIIGYFGALASWLDTALLEKMAERFPDAQIVLAGGIFDVDVSALKKLPNVHFLGQRPYEEMPQLLWHFDVCMIPFLINDITHATNPVKLYEYFYSGKPIVAPLLHELEPFAEVCYLATSHDEFLDHLGKALAEPADDPRRDMRPEIAASNDWSERYRSIDSTIREQLPLISVIIVTWGGLEHTRRCLASLEAETWPRLDILVVDNGSPDGTPAFLEEYAPVHDNVEVILNGENRGFAAANNQGLAQARGDILVLLNNDTIVPPGLMGRLAKWLLDESSIGLLCPTTNFCGNEALVEPGYSELDGLPRYAVWRAGAFHGKTIDLGVAAMYCLAMRREVFEKVGPLDAAFGIGMFEDDDYSLRVREAGLRVACAENAYVHHVGQASFAKLSGEQYQDLWEKNQTYFEKKWGRPWRPHKSRPGVRPVRSKVGSEGRAPEVHTPEKSRPKDEELVVQRWSEHGSDGESFSRNIYWGAIPEVQERLRQKLAHDQNDWVTYCVKTYIGDRAPVETMVSLGCGQGSLERQLASLNAFRRCDAFDITPDAITQARRLANEAGFSNIDYHVANIEDLELGAELYDAAWFAHSLHHVNDLEKVVELVANALKTDGLLFFNEYVGPSRFAFVPRQKEALSNAFGLIPKDYRRSFIAGYPEEFLQSPQIPDPKEVAKVDPSEAIRSEEILDVVRRYFEIVEKRDLGGTLLQFLLSGIAGNFREDDPRSLRILEMLFTIEDALMEVGDLESDFVVVVARPKRGG